jgi:hypothetical protein
LLVLRFEEFADLLAAGFKLQFEESVDLLARCLIRGIAESLLACFVIRGIADLFTDGLKLRFEESPDLLARFLSEELPNLFLLVS